jgi:hypothetical protein
LEEEEEEEKRSTSRAGRRLPARAPPAGARGAPAYDPTTMAARPGYG